MSTQPKAYQRFSLLQRIEHWVLVLSFTTLALTGLPQKYALSPISQFVVNLMGGIEAIRIIHRVAATLFLLEAIYHLVYVGYMLIVRRREASMLPSIKDAQDVAQSFKYNLGLAKEPPKMGRFNFVEKAEYWAMLWGLLVMAVTGFMLWNPVATTALLPGQFIPAAKIAHGGEAVLAVLAIILWHFYSVHIRHWNTSIFTGKLDRHAMADEHALEMERIDSGKIPPLPSPAKQRERLTFFVPVAAVVSLVMLGLVYWFVSFETSAITTIPPVEQAEVFSPATPTPVGNNAGSVDPTAAPTAEEPGQGSTDGGAPATVELAWSSGIGDLFQRRCASCHGETGDYNAESYASALLGIDPGNPSGSRALQVQSRGQHPGQFTPQELQQVRQWVAAGAPEQPGQGTGQQPAGGADTWNGGIAEMSQAKCGSCHGTMGGFSVQTYADMLKAITPGEPDDSDVVEVQQQGGHPGMFSADELTRLIEWIRAGAPE